MIFATVGTQLAFDRLIQPLDQWISHRNSVIKCFAQIGPTRYKPVHIPHADFLTPTQACQYMRDASLIVSHAGMGTILTALQLQKPVVIMPRKASLGEHRNDHQLATAKWLASRPGIAVAWDVEDLLRCLDSWDLITPGPALPASAESALVPRLAELISSW